MDAKKVIEDLYQDLSGFISYEPGEKESAQEKEVYLTYGEILPESVELLAKKLELSKDDVFCDLGSGIGKVAAQFFLEGVVQKSYGIEASQQRFDISKKVLEQLKAQQQASFVGSRELDFIHGNIMEADFNTFNIIFTCSTCFSQDLLEQIASKINEAESIRYVMSLKKLPEIKRLSLKETIPISCTWDKSQCFLYA